MSQEIARTQVDCGVQKDGSYRRRWCCGADEVWGVRASAIVTGAKRMRERGSKADYWEVSRATAECTCGGGEIGVTGWWKVDGGLMLLLQPVPGGSRDRGREGAGSGCGSNSALR